MTRDPRYDILFEPVKIGPVTAKNRFYQVPHCTGLGWQRPRMVAALRGVKAEGGWGVVCTEYCSIHPSSDDLPYVYASMWDEGDVKAHSLMTDLVHEHGSLAGVELWYGGGRSANLYSRETALSIDSRPNSVGNPYQTKAMDKADIREFRGWHKQAALRAKQAEFDVVYVYATHGYLLADFLSPTRNTRVDEYGGSLENRVRLVRELIEETKEAVGDRCAVAVRFSADEQTGEDGVPIHGERRDMFGLLAELPDLWDLNIEDYSYEMGASRFVKEAALEPYMAFAKSVTSKPIVTVGRFTSPDTMVSQIKRGITDFIGAARPSIADPFLPKKIEDGRAEDIRECIGCNVCYSGDGKGVPIRCTQNPTMGEEWRRGWHPEKITPKQSNDKVLIVGAGPAGLEAARALGQRGYAVLLAEATRNLGGRVSREAKLPGLAEWARVRDHRVQQIETMSNVEIFRESDLSADDVLAVGADHVAIATGARWRADGFGRYHVSPMKDLAPAEQIFTPDDIMAGRLPEGRTVIFDDDHYYMATVIAELLAKRNLPVTIVTTDDIVAAWSDYTYERRRAQLRLSELQVEILTAHGLEAFDGRQATLSCQYSSRRRQIDADAIVMVTARQTNDDLYHALSDKISTQNNGSAAPAITRIGDCDAPAIIAAAVYSGHRYARQLDTDKDNQPQPRRDRVFTP